MEFIGLGGLDHGISRAPSCNFGLNCKAQVACFEGLTSENKHQEVQLPFREHCRLGHPWSKPGSCSCKVAHQLQAIP